MSAKRCRRTAVSSPVASLMRKLLPYLMSCAHIVLKPTSLHLIPAYSSQSSDFSQTLAGVGLSELEWAGVGS